MATIKDIALRANVSVATVSYVLNNTRPVHPEKKSRVLRAIEELNYVPNASARGLRARKTKTIGLVISDITNPFYPDLAKGCQDAAQESDYTLMMYNTNDKNDQLGEMAKQIREGKVDGLILASIKQSDREIVADLLKGPYPLVFAHRKLDGFDIDSVTSDNYQGAVAATEHLIMNGHKQIAFVDGVEGSSVTQERRRGYETAMQNAELSTWIVQGNGKYESCYSEAIRILKVPKSKRPTAIFASSDIMAFAVIDAVKDLNLSIQIDISIMGYDDLFFSASRALELSTVRVPRYEIGRIATEMLLERIQDDAKPKVKNIVLPTELVIRNTSGELSN